VNFTCYRYDISLEFLIISLIGSQPAQECHYVRSFNLTEQLSQRYFKNSVWWISCSRCDNSLLVTY